jgi:hypothetical protein
MNYSDQFFLGIRPAEPSKIIVSMAWAGTLELEGNAFCHFGTNAFELNDVRVVLAEFRAARWTRLVALIPLPKRILV